MSNVYSGIAFQTLCCLAAGVERKLLCTAAQKSNASPVPDAHEKVQIQGARLSSGKNPATAAMLIAKLHHIRSGLRSTISRSSAPSNSMLFRDSSGLYSPMTPGRGEKPDLQFLFGLCSFVRKSSSFASQQRGESPCNHYKEVAE
jgi:hypothetical protein